MAGEPGIGQLVDVREIKMIEAAQARAAFPLGSLCVIGAAGGIGALCLFGFSTHASPYFALLGAVLGIPTGWIGRRSFRKACSMVPANSSAPATRQFVLKETRSGKFKNYQRIAILVICLAALVKCWPAASSNTFLAGFAPLELAMLVGCAAMFFVSECILLPDMGTLGGMRSARNDAANELPMLTSGHDSPGGNGTISPRFYGAFATAAFGVLFFVEPLRALPHVVHAHGLVSASAMRVVLLASLGFAILVGSAGFAMRSSWSYRMLVWSMGALIPFSVFLITRRDLIAAHTASERWQDLTYGTGLVVAMGVTLMFLRSRAVQNDFRPQATQSPDRMPGSSAPGESDGR
jgi:hypothetical protein